METKPVRERFRNDYSLKWHLSIILYIFLSVLLTSCFSAKKYTFFQDLTKDTSRTSILVKEKDFLLKIQPDDILNIDVISSNPAAAAPFNLNNMTSIGGYNNNNIEAIPVQGANPPTASISYKATNGYLVDRNGFVEMPLIGRFSVKDMTVPYLKDTLTEVLRTKYIKDAIVNAQIANAGALFMGEGGYRRVALDREKTSILDALAMSGAPTQYAKLDDVLLIRENNGVKSVHHINLQQSDIINSDNYYLRQNDIVYVPPRKDIGIARDNITFRVLQYFFSAVSVISLILAISK